MPHVKKKKEQLMKCGRHNIDQNFFKKRKLQARDPELTSGPRQIRKQMKHMPTKIGGHLPVPYLLMTIFVNMHNHM